MLVPAAAQAQSTGDTQRKLEKVNRELKEVAAERRKIEGRRGDASRQLREVDEKVGESTRGLRERSAERRVGKECVRSCRSRRSPYHQKEKPNTTDRRIRKKYDRTSNCRWSRYTHIIPTMTNSKVQYT